MFCGKSLLDGQLSNVERSQKMKNYTTINPENVTELSKNPMNTILWQNIREDWFLKSIKMIYILKSLY